MFQVAAGRDAGDADRLRDARGGEAVGGVAQGRGDAFQGGAAEALREGGRAGARRVARARSTSSWPLASPAAARNSAYRTSRSRSVAKVNGFSTYCTTPSDTPSRTTARSRAEVTAITSA